MQLPRSGPKGMPTTDAAAVLHSEGCPVPRTGFDVVVVPYLRHCAAYRAHPTKFSSSPQTVPVGNPELLAALTPDQARFVGEMDLSSLQPSDVMDRRVQLAIQHMPVVATRLGLMASPDATVDPRMLLPVERVVAACVLVGGCACVTVACLRNSPEGEPCPLRKPVCTYLSMSNGPQGDARNHALIYGLGAMLHKMHRECHTNCCWRRPPSRPGYGSAVSPDMPWFEDPLLPIAAYSVHPTIHRAYHAGIAHRIPAFKDAMDVNFGVLTDQRSSSLVARLCAAIQLTLPNMWRGQVYGFACATHIGGDGALIPQLTRNGQARLDRASMRLLGVSPLMGRPYAAGILHSLQRLVAELTSGDMARDSCLLASMCITRFGTPVSSEPPVVPWELVEPRTDPAVALISQITGAGYHPRVHTKLCEWIATARGGSGVSGPGVTTPPPAARAKVHAIFYDGVLPSELPWLQCMFAEDRVFPDVAVVLAGEAGLPSTAMLEEEAWALPLRLLGWAAAWLCSVRDHGGGVYVASAGQGRHRPAPGEFTWNPPGLAVALLDRVAFGHGQPETHALVIDRLMDVIRGHPRITDGRREQEKAYVGVILRACTDLVAFYLRCGTELPGGALLASIEFVGRVTRAVVCGTPLVVECGEVADSLMAQFKQSGMQPAAAWEHAAAVQVWRATGDPSSTTMAAVALLNWATSDPGMVLRAAALVPEPCRPEEGGLALTRHIRALAETRQTPCPAFVAWLGGTTTAAQRGIHESVCSAPAVFLWLRACMGFADGVGGGRVATDDQVLQRYSLQSAVGYRGLNQPVSYQEHAVAARGRRPASFPSSVGASNVLCNLAAYGGAGMENLGSLAYRRAAGEHRKQQPPPTTT